MCRCHCSPTDSAALQALANPKGKTEATEKTQAGQPANPAGSNRKSVNDPEVTAFMSEYIDQISPELRQISLSLWEKPELGFQEKHAHEVLTNSLKDLGFSISTVDELPTAFVAEYQHGSGGRTHGFCSEYDALKGIGHACGHNLIAICGVGAGAALKAAMIKFDISGTVKVIGTPAEEDGGGKVLMIQKGIFKSLDTCSMAHPAGNEDGKGWQGGCTIGGPGSLAICEVSSEFSGKGAHAGLNPWVGVNALDAAVASYNNIAMLRQQIEPDMRVHGLIRGNEDWNPNVIPNYAKMEFAVRALTSQKAKTLAERVAKCMKAGAQATGCTIKLSSPPTHDYAELQNNEPLAMTYRDLMEDAFDHKVDTVSMMTASTDFGNVCYEVPSIHPMFYIPITPGGNNHTKEFAAAAKNPEAHELAIKVTKGLAGVALRVLTDDAFYNAVKKTFEDQFKNVES